MRRLLLACCAFALGGCTILPGRDAPRPPPRSPAHPPNAALAEPFTASAREHPAESGFRLFAVGIDGLLLRLELIAQAHSTLDLQYYIFHGDESGRLITEALGQAAARGVRVRILVDDAETLPGDEQLFALAGRDNVEIRVFNPWRYRGHNLFVRGVEYLFSHRRLDYRMHNKLFIADGAIALIGGRNIGDQYFQDDPASQFADDDVLVSGPAVGELAFSFERFWASYPAIPAKALLPRHKTDGAAAQQLAVRSTPPHKAASAERNYREKLAAGQPLADVLAGQLPLSWAAAEVVSDSPDKSSRSAAGTGVDGLVFAPVATAIRGAHSELILITPYLIPTMGELELLEERRGQRRVRILTTSLEASNDALAQAGYMHYRKSLLKSGVQLYELRALPQNRHGTGQSPELSRYGRFSLHAKLLVFDRSGVFVGSMNFDQRSRRLNTENGAIIHSSELAEQAARHFASMTQPENAYAVTLEPAKSGDAPRLEWSTVKDGKLMELRSEPARSTWQKLEVNALTLLPIDREL